MAYDFGEVNLQQPIKLVGGSPDKYKSCLVKFLKQRLVGYSLITPCPQILSLSTKITGGEISKIVDQHFDMVLNVCLTFWTS